MSAERSGNNLVELSKKMDKIGMAGGVGIYILLGIPAALSIAAFSAVTYAGTIGGEKIYRNWKTKAKGK